MKFRIRTVIINKCQYVHIAMWLKRVYSFILHFLLKHLISFTLPLRAICYVDSALVGTI